MLIIVLLQPSETQSPSGNKFSFDYDTSGNLKSVLTPTGKEHKFAQTTELGVVSHFYHLPTSTLPFIRLTDVAGRLLGLLQPESSRRATFVHQPDTNRLERIYFGRFSTRFHYDSGSRRPARTQVNYGDNASLTSTLRFQGDLVSETTVRMDLASQLGSTVAQFSYHYDDFLRLTSVSAAVDDVSLEPLKFTYDPATGRITRFNSFEFQTVPDNKIRLINDRLIVERAFNPTMRPTREVYTIRGRSVCQLQFNYDRLDRLKEVSIRLPNTDATSERYEYNSDGLLSAAVVDDRFAWAFRYNSDGQTVAVNSQSVGLDPRGLINSLGDLPYKTDLSGFIVSRGAERFDYDSFGRLIRAEQRGQAAVTYFYDQYNRLASRLEGPAAVTFFYGLPGSQHRHLITHTVERPSGIRSIFTYESDGRLLAVQRDGRDYFVVTGADLSPKFVFADDGDLVKSLVHSPNGEVVADSNGEFRLPVGFRGNFQDWRNGLVITGTGRPYDPLSGRWMAAGPDDIFETPNPLDPVRTSNKFDFQPAPAPTFSHHSGLHRWLGRLGYDLDRLAPHMDETTDSGVFRLCDPLDPVHIGVECGMDRRATYFRQILSVKPSPLSLLRWPIERPTIAAGPNPYGADGIVVANLSGRAAINVADSVVDSQVAAVMSGLLNDSAILPLRFVREGRSYRHFAKATVDAAADLVTVGLPAVDNITTAVTPNLNVTLHRNAGGAAEVHIDTRLASMVLFYGRSVEAVTERLVSDAFIQATNSAWLRERTALISGLQSAQNWTEAERAELAQTTRVSGYSAEFLLGNINDWPLLADDSSLVRFVRHTDKLR